LWYIIANGELIDDKREIGQKGCDMSIIERGGQAESIIKGRGYGLTRSRLRRYNNAMEAEMMDLRSKYLRKL
jgi:hypothetical protein